MGREFIFTSPSYHAGAYRDYGEPLPKPIVNVFTMAQPESKATEPKRHGLDEPSFADLFFLRASRKIHIARIIKAAVASTRFPNSSRNAPSCICRSSPRRDANKRGAVGLWKSQEGQECDGRRHHHQHFGLKSQTPAPKSAQLSLAPARGSAELLPIPRHLDPQRLGREFAAMTGSDLRLIIIIICVPCSVAVKYSAGGVRG